MNRGGGMTQSMVIKPQENKTWCQERLKESNTIAFSMDMRENRVG
jgi:hypothetical protein